MTENDGPVAVQTHKSVTISDRDSGKTIFELTSKNGLVSIARRSTSKTTVPLEDLAEAVRALA